MDCARCQKDIPKGQRRKICGAPKLARFCFDCWKSNLAAFWCLKDIFDFKKGGWNFRV